MHAMGCDRIKTALELTITRPCHPKKNLELLLYQFRQEHIVR